MCLSVFFFVKRSRETQQLVFGEQSVHENFMLRVSRETFLLKEKLIEQRYLKKCKLF